MSVEGIHASLAFHGPVSSGCVLGATAMHARVLRLTLLDNQGTIGFAGVCCGLRWAARDRSRGSDGPGQGQPRRGVLRCRPCCRCHQHRMTGACVDISVRCGSAVQAIHCITLLLSWVMDISTPVKLAGFLGSRHTCATTSLHSSWRLWGSSQSAQTGSERDLYRALSLSARAFQCSAASTHAGVCCTE